MDGYDGPARPVLAALAAPFSTLYAELLSNANRALTADLSAMEKSVAVVHLRLIRGGADLRKADGAPTVSAPKAPGVQKIKHPGSRGGKWYRDDHGNVRYGTKPTPRYHTALGDDEESQLHTNIAASVAEMSTTSLNHLADAMEVDRSVLTTLRTVVQQAASQGVDPQTCFAETYAASFAAEGAALDPKVLDEGHQLYANMATAYKETVNDEKFQKAAKISLSRQRQQAVNAAQAVDRQREVVKGHFDALLNGNVAHESIKGLGIMHDLGLFTMPKTLSEAKQYTSDIEEARKLVGRAGINGDRLAAAMKFGDALEPEQQVSLVATVMLGEEQTKRMEDPLHDRDAFWAGMRDNPGLDELRELLKGHGKDYTDAEWEQVKDRTLQLARNVSDHIQAYNENQGGHVFKALFHNTTDVKKLFSDPAEVDRLNEVEAEVRARVQRALKAQTDYDHPLEPNITAAMKQIAGPDGDMFGFQKAAVSWMTEIKSGVLAYDAGTGKMQPDNTPTLTPTGWRMLGDLLPGDHVIGRDGKPVQVLAIFPKGILPVFEVKFSDGTSTRCGGEHMWHVFSTTQMRRGQHEVIDVYEMLQRGLTTPNGRARFMIPLCEPVQYQATAQPIPAYTLGVLLGDGALSDGYSVGLANSNAQVLAKVAGEAPAGISAVVHQSSGTGDNWRLSTGQRGASNVYSAALRVLGLQGCRSHEKFIPEVYLRGSVDQRLALLRGLCDTDGFCSADGSNVMYYSTSRRLASGVQELVQSLGGVARLKCKDKPTFTYKGETRTGKPCWVVNINLPRSINPFTRDDRASRYRLRDARKPWGLNRTIVAIAPVGCAYQRCIKVANPDGLYLTNDHIVTHNTPISIAFVSHLIASGKAKRGIMVLPANLVAQWPKEIERFRPGSKVQVISADSGSVEDRILKLKAINSGQLDADFVILSAGTLNLHQNTQAAIETESTDLAKKLGKKRISKEARARLMREGSHLDNDPMVQELKNLEGAMIFDEAHHGGQGLKDPTNTHHLIAQHVLKDREYKFGMSATPMPDGPEDLFHLANLFHPGAAGESMTKFNSSLVKYKTSFDPDTGEKKVVPIAKDMKEMEATKRAISPYVFFQRKTGKKVTEEMAAKGMSLPKLNSVAHALHLTAEAREVYDKCTEIGFDEGREPLYGHPEGYLTDREMHKKISEEHDPKAADMVMKMRAFVRQQRAAISPKLLDKNYKGPSPKIDESIEIIKRHFADPSNADKPVVIFGSWMDSLDLMHDEMVKAGLPSHLIGKITGQVSVQDRDVVQDAVNAGKLKVVLIGIKAGGAGLNLQKKAFRNIFLDKPWTPADMEQAVGRTWRTGATADTVHVHHMKVADTTDERKYTKLGEKTSLVDSLSFADQSEDYLGGMVAASLTRVRGDFDKPLKEMTPQQHEELMQMAGLKPTDQPFASIPALREHFDLQKFGEAKKHERWKAAGDERIKEMAVMNDLRLQAGRIDVSTHKRAKAKIGALARKWMRDVNAAADHPVAKYVGEDFHYGTEATHSLAAERKDFDPAQESRHRIPEAQLPPPMPLSSTLTHKSQLRWLSADADIFEPTSTAWPIYDMVRRERPASVAGVAKSLARCLVDMGVADQAAEERAWQYLEMSGLLETCRDRRVVEVV